MGRSKSKLILVPGLCVAGTFLGLSVSSGEGRAVGLRAAAAGERTDIFVVRPGRPRLTRITDHREGVEEEVAYSPSWSPDAQRIAFVEIACEFCRPLIRVAPARPLRGGRLGRALALGFEPRFSPDGKRIVFVGRDGGIHLVRADGSHRHLLVKGGLADDGPSWSPDGRRIVFSRQESATRWRLYIVGVDGKNLHRLPTGLRAAVNPAWSPGGGKIAFAGQVGRWHIYTVGVHGRNRRRVSGLRTSDTSPAWSPNGRRLAFVRQEGSAFAVFTMTAAGSHVRRTTPRWMSAIQPAWSSTGKIAFVGGER